MVDVQPRFSTVVLAKEKKEEENKTATTQHNNFASGFNLHSPVKPKTKSKNSKTKRRKL